MLELGREVLLPLLGSGRLEHRSPLALVWLIDAESPLPLLVFGFSEYCHAL